MERRTPTAAIRGSHKASATKGERLARTAALLSLAITVALAGIMIASENYVALLFVIPATLSGLLSLLWPGQPLVLWGAAALLFLNIFLLLIGWIGLLFVPSLCLLIVAALRLQRTGG